MTIRRINKDKQNTSTNSSKKKKLQEHIYANAKLLDPWFKYPPVRNMQNNQPLTKKKIVSKACLDYLAIFSDATITCTRSYIAL